MKDWRVRDTSRDWSKASVAEKNERTWELTLEVWRRAGLDPGTGLDKTIFRKLTLEQMKEEDEALDRLLLERLN